MDRQDILKRLLYPKCKSAIEFQFDSLRANPLLMYITPQDIHELNKIATSLKYSSKPKEKYIMIDKILVARGFKKMASGTNRVTYRFLNDYSIVLKVAIDKVGLSDNGNEFRNQQLLKPFVTKCFEVSPCGTVGLFERVVPITSREEFENIADDVFDLINNLIGKYVLEDIGEKFYMNYGLREGFGPVLLDYPYVFELDGRKLICNVQDPFEPLGYCGGEIDYDLGYNDLICKKCGKRYLATELKAEEKSDKPKIIVQGEDMIMKCVLKRGDEVIAKLNSEEPVSVDTIPSRNRYDKMKGNLSRREQNQNNRGYRPNIKTSDDVGLKCRLKGYPKGKNLDREAIKKDEYLERNTPKIPVDLSEDKILENIPLGNVHGGQQTGYTPYAKIVTDEKDFLSKVDEMDSSTLDLKSKEEQKPITDKEIQRKEEALSAFSEQLQYNNEKEETYFLKVAYRGNEIWNVVTNELVGYRSLTLCDNENEVKPDPIYYPAVNSEPVVEMDYEPLSSQEYDEPSTDKTDDNETVYESKDESEGSGFTIGECLGDKLKMFTEPEPQQPARNYSSKKFTSQVPNHFAAKPKKKIKDKDLKTLNDNY